MGEGDDEVHVNIEKTDDEEEINARNEVNISLNDSTSEYNRNANVTVKSKDKDVPDLMKIALEALEKIRISKQTNKNDKAGQHFG